MRGTRNLRVMTTQPPYVLKSRRFHSVDITIHVAEVAGVGVFVHDCTDDPSARWSRGSQSLESAQAEADAALLATGHGCDRDCRPWTPHTAPERRESPIKNEIHAR
jgi:hypothetical protein